jgi:hypothetical protein
VYARPTLDKWDDLRMAGIPMNFGDEWLRIGGLKGFVDGIQGNSTARFYEPQLHSGSRGAWRDSTNTGATLGPGSGMMPAGNIDRLLFGLDSAGYWAQVHDAPAVHSHLAPYDSLVRRLPRHLRDPATPLLDSIWARLGGRD